MSAVGSMIGRYFDGKNLATASTPSIRVEIVGEHVVVLDDVVRRGESALPRHVEDSVHTKRDLVSQGGEIGVLQRGAVAEDEAPLAPVSSP